MLGFRVPGKRFIILNSFDDAVELLEKRAGIYSDRARIALPEM